MGQRFVTELQPVELLQVGGQNAKAVVGYFDGQEEPDFRFKGGVRAVHDEKVANVRSEPVEVVRECLTNRGTWWSGVKFSFLLEMVICGNVSNNKQILKIRTV